MAENNILQNSPGPSDRKIAANRENAKKSTGPQTAAGKARSSQNALKYGLTASTVVMLGEDVQAYYELKWRIWKGVRPQNIIESLCVDEIVETTWRLKRIGFAEAMILAKNSFLHSDGIYDPGAAFMIDAAGSNTLAKLTTYETGLSRKRQKSLDTLMKSRKGGWQNLDLPQDYALIEPCPQPPGAPEPPGEDITEPEIPGQAQNDTGHEQNPTDGVSTDDDGGPSI